MSTGITAADNLQEQFDNFKKQSNKQTYSIYHINDATKKVELLKVSEEGATFAEFLEELPEKSGRYALYKMQYITNDEREAEKVVFISWWVEIPNDTFKKYLMLPNFYRVPDSAKVKEKMLYAGTKDAVNKVFGGISVKLNATDKSELTEHDVKEACKKF